MMSSVPVPGPKKPSYSPHASPMPAQPHSRPAVMGALCSGASLLKSRISAMSGMTTTSRMRMISGSHNCSSSAPRYAPGSAPAIAQRDGLTSSLPPRRNLPVATSVPRQADILFEPDASAGGNPVSR